MSITPKTCLSNEPHREKTGLLHMRKQRRRSACGNRKADQHPCFRYTDSTIPLLPKFEISSFEPSSMAVQPGLCRTWSKTPKTGFLTTRLIFEPLHEKTCILHMQTTKWQISFTSVQADQGLYRSLLRYYNLVSRSEIFSC